MENIIQKRDLSIDGLKGLAIIFIILIHCTFNEKGFYFNQFLDVFSKFGVPLFIFLSGYLLYTKKDQILNNFKKYLLGRIVKIGIPYILITLLVVIINNDTFNNFIFFLITGTVLVPYYFIIVIFQLYFISKIILKLYISKYKFLLSISIVLILLYSLLYYYQIHTKGTIYIPFFMWQFPNYLLWFVMGIDYSAKGKIFSFFNKLSSKYIIILFFISLLLCLLEVNYHYKNNLPDGNYIALSSIIWEFFSIVYLWNYRHYFENKFFVILGLNSFGIFLIFDLILQLYFQYLGFPKNQYLAIVYLIAVISISLIILTLFKKIDKLIKVIIKKYIIYI